VTRTPIILGTVLVVSSLAACGTSARDGSESAQSLSTDPQVDVADADASDGGVATTDGAAPGDAGAIVQVLVKSMTFEPSDVTIHPGDTVHWVWNRGRHNVVSGPVAGGAGVADGKFCNPGAASCSAAPLQAPPYTYDHTFTDAGDFPYFCTPHVAMGMVGTVHVVP
jgi:plastocyanin